MSLLSRDLMRTPAHGTRQGVAARRPAAAAPVVARPAPPSAPATHTEPAPGLLASLATAAAAVTVLLGSSPAFAAPAQELFANKCAGCHAGGGNILSPGASLFPADLKRNGVDSPEALYKIIYGGKNRMPGYGQECAPKLACTFGPRLSDEEVKDLATFVAERAAAGWKE